jgi:hypothetical protein
LAISLSLQGFLLGLTVILQKGYWDTELFFLSSGIYIISWLIGFITPGASGGLGVREGSFIAIMTLLHVNISNEIILFSILLVRFLNIFVDISMYLFSYTIKNSLIFKDKY